jgi:hypothetical protein
MDEGPSCGPGTVERDGRCVAIDEPATTMSGGVTQGGASSQDDAGDDAGDDEGPDTAGSASVAESSNESEGDQGEDDDGSASAAESSDDDEPYGACPSESDVECREGEYCVAGLACGEPCDVDSECLEVEVGVPICDKWFSICMLSCEGNTPCPTAMSCDEIEGDMRCIWP